MRHPIQSSHLQTGCGCTRPHLGIARGPRPNWSSRLLAILRKSIGALPPCYVQQMWLEILSAVCCWSKACCRSGQGVLRELWILPRKAFEDCDSKGGKLLEPLLPPLPLARQITKTRTPKFLWHTISQRQSIGDTERPMVWPQVECSQCDKWWGTNYNQMMWRAGTTQPSGVTFKREWLELSLHSTIGRSLC